MTTTANPNSPPTSEAPWKKLFSSHLSKMDSPEFVFSSLTPASRSEARDGKTPVPYVPRARFCIFRSFWAELPENKHNTAEKNERVYESDLPSFTTDVRMQKTFEIFASSAGKADDESLVQGSGGGGPCEAVWWVNLPDKGIKMQWRFKGEAYIVASQDIDEVGEAQTSGVKHVKSELSRRMRVVKESGVDGWSWKKEVRAHFGNMSPGMRGESFCALQLPSGPVTGMHLSLCQGDWQPDTMVCSGSRCKASDYVRMEGTSVIEPQCVNYSEHWRFGCCSPRLMGDVRNDLQLHCNSEPQLMIDVYRLFSEPAARPAS